MIVTDLYRNKRNSHINYELILNRKLLDDNNPQNEETAVGLIVTAGFQIVLIRNRIKW